MFEKYRKFLNYFTITSSFVFFRINNDQSFLRKSTQLLCTIRYRSRCWTKKKMKEITNVINAKDIFKIQEHLKWARNGFSYNNDNYGKKIIIKTGQKAEKPAQEWIWGYMSNPSLILTQSSFALIIFQDVLKCRQIVLK